MKISLCNEVLGAMPFAAQCDYAAALGYDGLELAPFTLGDEPQRLAARARAELRRAATDAGIEITGLHWLLVTPEGLSITTADEGRRQRTLEEAAIRTTNPIESTFAAVRLRTAKTRNNLSRESMLSLVFKLCQGAQRRWLRLKGSELLKDMIKDVRFILVVLGLSQGRKDSLMVSEWIN